MVEYTKHFSLSKASPKCTIFITFLHNEFHRGLREPTIANWWQDHKAIHTSIMVSSIVTVHTVGVQLRLDQIRVGTMVTLALRLSVWINQVIWQVVFNVDTKINIKWSFTMKQTYSYHTNLQYLVLWRNPCSCIEFTMGQEHNPEWSRTRNTAQQH